MTTVMSVTRLRESIGVGAKPRRRYTICSWQGRSVTSAEVYESFRAKYKECIRMLNGLEKTLERKLPEGERGWVVKERPETYSDNSDIVDSGWPIPPET